MMPTVLFICTGNLCRSPMAEALLKARLARDEARRGWLVESAGVWTTDGRPASANAVAEMSRRGIDLHAHRSRNVTHALVTEADLVLAMSRGHVEAMSAAFPKHAHKMHLLSEMVGQARDIDDPYGGTPEEYSRTAAQLDQLIADGYERIVELVEGLEEDL